jgi:hypothetical protein
MPVGLTGLRPQAINVPELTWTDGGFQINRTAIPRPFQFVADIANGHNGVEEWGVVLAADGVVLMTTKKGKVVPMQKAYRRWDINIDQTPPGPDLTWANCASEIGLLRRL